VLRLGINVDQPPKASQLYRGLTVPVEGEKRGISMTRGFLHLEGKATAKLSRARLIGSLVGLPLAIAELIQIHERQRPFRFLAPRFLSLLSPFIRMKANLALCLLHRGFE
jgi:hypothetical protein